MKILTETILSMTVLLCLPVLTGCEGGEAVMPEPASDSDTRLEFSARMLSSGATGSRGVLGDEASFPAGNYHFGTWICDHSRLPDFVPAKTGYANLQTNLGVAPDGLQSWTYSFEDGRFGTTLNVNHGVSIDIYTFYPRPQSGTQATSPDNVPFTSGATDWMWAKSSVSADQLKGEKVNVVLEFSHAMTCLRVRIRCNHAGAIYLNSITLKDKKIPSRLYTRGSMNLATQTLTLEEGSRTAALKVNCANLLNNKVETDLYIFIPPVEGYSDGDFTLAFVFNGITGKTEFSIPATIKDKDGNNVTISGFETGKRYTYSLTLDNTVVFVPVNVDDNWETIERDLIL